MHCFGSGNAVQGVLNLSRHEGSLGWGLERDMCTVCDSAMWEGMPNLSNIQTVELGVRERCIHSLVSGDLGRAVPNLPQDAGTPRWGLERIAHMVWGPGT